MISPNNYQMKNVNFFTTNNQLLNVFFLNVAIILILELIKMEASK